MNKPYHFIATALLLLAVSIASCDDNANKREGFEGINLYKGMTQISLYAPKWEIENDDDAEDGKLCTNLFPTQFMIDISKDETAVITCDEMNGMDFRMPYLDADNEVRPIFRQGKFAHLYNKMKDAAEKGLIDPERFQQFQKDIKIINDTLSIGFIESCSLPLIERGASLTTWDDEQKSPYVRFSINDIHVERRSSIFTAILKIKDLLTKWYELGLISQEDLQLLQEIKNQEKITITDGNGWMTSMYVNLHADFDMHLENATGLLDVVSGALFGYDEQGKLNQPLWIVISFFGETDWSNI